AGGANRTWQAARIPAKAKPTEAKPMPGKRPTIDRWVKAVAFRGRAIASSSDCLGARQMTNAANITPVMCAAMQYGQKDFTIHFCTMTNHTALPAAAPTRISIARQASRRTGEGVAGPMEKLAISSAEYTPAARPLTGRTPAIVDHRLLSTWSHELPPPQPITDPPIIECQLR